MKPTVSVIVPLYNAEFYIGRALQSIRDQTFTDFECIIVDDGSTDNSRQVCDPYIRRDARFSLIHQKNGGLSAARNRGLAKSRGDYVAFIDSDDFVAPDFLETLYRGITECDAAIAQAGILKVKSEELICLHPCSGAASHPHDGAKPHPSDGAEPHPHDKQFVPVDSGFCLARLASPDNLDYLSVCNKLFHKSVFDKLRFLENRLYEDMYINYLLYARAKRIAVCTAKKYFYFRHPDSICETSPLFLSEDYANALLGRMVFYSKGLPPGSPAYSQNLSYTGRLLRSFVSERWAAGCYERAAALAFKQLAYLLYARSLHRIHHHPKQ